MQEVAFASGDGSVVLDLCRTCHLIWFDPGELMCLPRLPEEVGDTERSRGIKDELQERKRRRDRDTVDTYLQRGPMAIGGVPTPDGEGRLKLQRLPEGIWDQLVAILGVPAEMGVQPLRIVPWLTWSLIALLFAVNLLLGFDSQVARDFGLIPAHWDRHGGFDFLSSFVLHGDLLHLFFNCCFLWVFGDNCEDYLGRPLFALLLIGAALGGSVAHIAAYPSSTVPLVGASGAISGAMLFYALQFPRAKLGRASHLGAIWIHYPAWAGIGLWLLFQVFAAFRHAGDGEAGVAYLAHIGGALVGACLWLGLRIRESAAEAP